MVRSNPRQLRLPTISTRLKEIATTRAHLLHQLAELAAESQALIVEHKSIINDNAAISTLPNEILAAIFQAGHDSQAVGDHFEILISSVTKHWRDVALATPPLWTVILCAVVRQQLEATALYIHRSKAAPIELKIIMHRMKRTDFGHLCQLLTPHFSRCNRLAIESNYKRMTELSALFRCLHAVSAPLLRLIVIDFQASVDDAISLFARGRIFTGGTPRLTSIRITNIGLQACLPPLSSVNAIYIHDQYYRSTGITIDEWVQMMSSAPSLVHLEMHVDITVNHRTASLVVEMPLLRTLSIRALAVPELEPAFHAFLGCTTAPQLEVLILKNVNPDSEYTIRPNPFPSLHTHFAICLLQL